MKTNVSFEFFPPHTEKGSQKLLQTAKLLEAAQPEYFSVTFGAGGSTQTQTPTAVYNLQDHTKTSVAPHISCVGSSFDSINTLLTQYHHHHVHQLVTLRGDLPSGMVSRGDFKHAIDLVHFIKQHYPEQFKIHVACYPECHPQSRNCKEDFTHFHEKVSAGADTAITQYFYNADAYFYFLDKCQKHNITIPIVPGIMPITNYYRLAHFSEMCGAEIPRWARKQLEAYAEDEVALKAFGIDFVSHLCENLIQGGVENLHFYTLNQAEPTLTICKNLKLY